ncbi:MAG: hypothetical protein K6U79_04840 [Firmicutes bacterium]|nr:hypothetical protein [Bacillota bacterium]
MPPPGGLANRYAFSFREQGLPVGGTVAWEGSSVDLLVELPRAEARPSLLPEPLALSDGGSAALYRPGGSDFLIAWSQGERTYVALGADLARLRALAAEAPGSPPPAP